MSPGSTDATPRVATDSRSDDAAASFRPRYRTMPKVAQSWALSSLASGGEHARTSRARSTSTLVASAPTVARDAAPLSLTRMGIFVSGRGEPQAGGRTKKPRDCRLSPALPGCPGWGPGQRARLLRGSASDSPCVGDPRASSPRERELSNMCDRGRRRVSRQRERDRESTSLAGGKRKRSTVTLDDLLAERQAQPVASLLGREER